MDKSYPLDNTEYTAEYARLYNATRTTGVYSSDDDFAVTAGGGMAVNLSPGIAWFQISKFEGLVHANDETQTFYIDTADGAYNRIDRITLRYDEIGDGERPTVYTYVKKGVPSSNPTAPAIQRDAEAYEIVVADIDVSRGTLQLSQENIRDQRLNDSVCGVMKDGVTTIPTQSLYDAWWAWFSNLKIDAEDKVRNLNEWIALFKSNSETEFDSWLDARESEFRKWFNEIQEALEGDVVTNLINMIYKRALIHVSLTEPEEFERGDWWYKATPI